jgi:glycerol kinase
MSKLILAIDQGTTGSTALLIDEKLGVVGKVNREFRQVFPRPGWVEHEGAAIWESVESSITAALKEAKVNAKDIAAIGITNQRETTCLFEPGGKPLHNFIVWQDRRTASRCQELRAQGKEALVKEKTGLVLDPYFSGTKMEHLLENIPGSREKAEQGKALFGTIDTWLVHKLTAGTSFVTDATNASRTLLMDLKTCAWDKELLEPARSCC